MRIYHVGNYVPVKSGDGYETKNVCDVWCRSSETKPTDGLADGSVCTEIDTGKVFFYDEVNQSWVEQFTFQS